MGIRQSCAATGTIALLAALVGCSPSPAAHTTPARATTTLAPPLFVDVAQRAGIRFRQTNGATGKFYFIEDTPGGCAFLDYDNDGFLDIFLVQSGPSEPFEKVQDRPHCALYHNNRDGTFTDVTAGSGLDRDLGYAQGVAIGDYDNDGYDDILVTGYGGNHLFHNEHGTGKFTDVTHRMGLDNVKGYATSAAFGDYDNDGKLDLYICYYVPWSWDTNLPCTSLSGLDYCSPEVYPPAVHHLYHNEGSRFVDVSEKAGITREKGRGLGVAFLDYDGDGKQDIFVANDLTPNMLWHNNGNGTFTDVAARAGCAYDESGSLMSGMGICLADYDHSGRESIFVGNFSNKPNMLYKNMGGLFRDESYASGLALPHLKFLTFGCEFFDYDADGWPELITANGHVTLNAAAQTSGVSYMERDQLFHNEGNGTFREITSPQLLGDLARPGVSRGLAVGDYDNDGRLDVMIMRQNDTVQLFHNEDHSGNHWIAFKTVGTKSNRDGIHTQFILVADGMRQTATVHGGSSYLSASDRRVYFGLGKAKSVSRVEIRWPSGKRDVLSNTAADRIYIVTEGLGITGVQAVRH